MLDAENQITLEELRLGVQLSAPEIPLTPQLMRSAMSVGGAQSPVTSSIWNQETPWTQSLVLEAQLFWHTTKRDLTASIVPAVLFMRASIVGADGPTHQGMDDIAYLRCIPNMVLMAPKDEAELQQMLMSKLFPSLATLNIFLTFFTFHSLYKTTSIKG
jgi:hypothetical protein